MGHKNHRRGGSHARQLIDYFRVLNSGDRAGWERVFDQTWHPEGIIDQWSTEELRHQHRGRLGSGLAENVHVIRDLDDDRVEFTAEVNGKYRGPFVATFRDGRIYRVL